MRRPYCVFRCEWGVPALICVPEIPTNPRESGSARKRHATTYSLDRGSPSRRVASPRLSSPHLASPSVPSHPIPSHPIPSHPIPSCPIPSHPVPSRSVPFCPVPLIRAWTISLLVLEVADGTRGGSGGCSGVCRRNYTIKWCPDGRQLGAPWYSPFSSCHSESICIVMAPRVASLPTPLRINTTVDCHRKYRPSETKPSSHSFP